MENDLKFHLALRRRLPQAQLLRRLTLVGLATVFTPLILSAQDKTAAPAPDVVILNNGDQLTGKLERGVGDSILFKSDVVGEVTIPLSKVKDLKSSSNFVVLRKDEKVTRAPKQ